MADTALSRIPLNSCKYNMIHYFRYLKNEKEIEVLINPFISVYQNKVMDQLEGQIASAKIEIARLSCTSFIGYPDELKILCLANNTQKQYILRSINLITAF